MRTARLNVAGMSCGHCVETVEKALLNQKGVRNATVHLESGAAEVEYEESAVAPEQLVEAVRESGYEAELAGQDVAGAP
ncbi:MAG TPA: cation transporter [Longimicrobiaceae bacterium]